MKPFDQVFSISADEIVDLKFLQNLKSKGFSRIPVYVGNKAYGLIIGFVILKSFVGLEIGERLKIRDLIK